MRSHLRFRNAASTEFATDTRPPRKPTAIDLFCGAGGVTEGLRQAGFSVIGAVELDPLACMAFRANHPKVKLWEKDIRTLSPKTMMGQLKIRRGRLDLLAACPPCQSFSRMRTKNGPQRLRLVQNYLIFEVRRLARGMRPKTIMIENVPGLLKRGIFRQFCRSLESLGYSLKYTILDAANFGVPQRRKRLVLIASCGVVPDFAAPSRERRTVRDAIGTLSRRQLKFDPLHNYRSNRSARIEKLIAKIPLDGGSRKSLGRANQLECHIRIDGFRDVYGRMKWDKPAPTITCGCINPSKGRFLHPTENRAITLREAALLQSFPPRYSFPLERGRFAAATLIGNALPPELIRRQAEALKSLLEKTPTN